MSQEPPYLAPSITSLRIVGMKSSVPSRVPPTVVSNGLTLSSSPGARQRPDTFLVGLAGQIVQGPGRRSIIFDWHSSRCRRGDLTIRIGQALLPCQPGRGFGGYFERVPWRGGDESGADGNETPDFPEAEIRGFLFCSMNPWMPSLSGALGGDCLLCGITADQFGPTPKVSLL
jgi:hypothetical protein